MSTGKDTGELGKRKRAREGTEGTEKIAYQGVP
jgi:hypothetical protein